MRRWLLVALAAGSFAPPASAAVHIGARSAAVTTAAGSARVYRSPFRIVFADPRGQVVLREARGRGPSLHLPPPPPPLAPGYGPPLQPTSYAPLEFTVGVEQDEVRNSGTWAGDLASSVRAGVVYHALRARSIRRCGAGICLLVATDDPSGRSLRVRLWPGAGGVLRVRASASPATGVVGIGDSFASGPREQFHGFGGRHIGLDQRGRSFYSWTAEENVNATSFGIPGSKSGTLLYPNGPEAAYYPQASFISSRGYGFLLDQTQLARFRLDDGRATWQADVSARSLEYAVAPGQPPRAIDELTAITGRQPAPPRWALEPMLDREAQLSGTPAAYLAQVHSDLAGIRRYRLPLGGYRIEGWERLTASELRGVVAALHRMRLHALSYLRPFASEDVAGTEAPGTYQYVLAHRLVATAANGSPFVFGDSLGGKAVLLDFTNPATVRWWTAHVRRALELGADGFMQDFGEEVMPDMHFHDGETGLSMHNRYPVLYARLTRRVLEQYMRAHPRRRLFFFSRAGYSGSPGSAAYEGGNFAGDETTDWTRSSGLDSVVPDMLNRAIGGAYGYTTDIGGYFDVFTPHPTTNELFLRWAELAVFTPFFRLHGSLFAGTHVPWRYGARTVRVYNRLSRLHERAVPLILRLWRRADRTGMPPTRPLWLAYPNDRRAAAQDQEWLLGDDLLAAPVVTAGARTRIVYLPRGCWRRATDHRVLRGPRTVRIAAPLDTLPYFTRCGTHPLG